MNKIFNTLSEQYHRTETILFWFIVAGLGIFLPLINNGFVYIKIRGVSDF
jgi:hypothetical protein